MRTLLGKDDLPLQIAQPNKASVIDEIDKILARILTGPGQIIGDVIAVEMNLKALSPTLWPVSSFSLMSGSPAAATSVGIQSSWATISL